MFQTKANVLDRIAQAFGIMMQAPLALMVPFVVFNLIMTHFIPAVFTQLFPLGNMSSQNISLLISLGVTIGILYAIIFLILLIPIKSAIIKSSFDLVRGKPLDIYTNIMYGFSRLGILFRVYWYIFEYVYLYPALGIIVGGLLAIIGMLTQIGILLSLSYIIITLSIFWGIVWGIYRGVKTSFSITHSIFGDTFEKNDFTSSVEITGEKWWRILGNLLLVGIIGSLIMGLVTGLLGTLSFFQKSTTNLEKIISQTGGEAMDIQTILGDLGGFHIGVFIIDGIVVALNSILAVFITVFMVVFYLRLRAELEQNISHGKQLIDHKSQKPEPQEEL